MNFLRANNIVSVEIATIILLSGMTYYTDFNNWFYVLLILYALGHVLLLILGTAGLIFTYVWNRDELPKKDAPIHSVKTIVESLLLFAPAIVLYNAPHNIISVGAIIYGIILVGFHVSRTFIKYNLKKENEDGT